MGETFNMGSGIYSGFSLIVLTAGLWKIFEKLGGTGWWALIPGWRWYKLGELCGRERDGIAAFILEISMFIMRLTLDVLENGTNTYMMCLLTAMVAVMMLAVSEIRIGAGVCRRFSQPKKWLFLWGIASWIPAALWGFSDQYQPAGSSDSPEEQESAGTKPAEISFSQQTLHPVGDGLTVNLKERTVRDFRKTRYLLKDISLNIPNYSLVLLLGGSGSGKTTFVNAITGYEKANAEVLLNGENIYQNYDTMKYRIGFVPQQELIRLNDTVLDTLQDAAKLRLPVSEDRKERKARIDEVMDILGLETGSEGLVSKKSGGMKKRISIATELICKPELFILDEPDSGLDGVIAKELFNTLRKIADEGHIVITITHIPDRVAHLFDQVIVLARDSGRVGRLAFSGTPDEARAFFGKETMEEIVMAVSKKDDGGEGRADEFIAKYAEYMKQKNMQEADHE